MEASLTKTEILIAGAGPTGLVLALWLTHFGVRVRIVDKTAEPGTTSRALAVQARTLELYAQMGLADRVVADGRKVFGLNLWVKGKQAAHVFLGEMGAGLSPFSFALVYPQAEHERLLIEKLSEVGVQVERQTELMAFEENEGGIVAHLKRPDGTLETCEAAYVAGCDGAHSVVRQTLGIGFPGGSYEHLFYVADVEATGATMNGELQVGLDRTDFLALFPLKGDGNVRLVGTVRESEHPQKDLSWEDVGRRVIEWMHLDVKKLNWFSTYRVHHRVAERFRVGRAFLLGDAGHIHSPVGGQGMNTGIGDAVNLAWKLAAVLQGRADTMLLNSYEPERIAFARRLVATTDEAFTGVTSSVWVARLVRLHLVPLLLPVIYSFRRVRRFLFRTVSQTSVNYRGSALSEGRAGQVHGGDRLPWVKDAGNSNDSARGNGPDNFAPLTSRSWQVHVYGEAPAKLKGVCETLQLPLHVFPFTPGAKAAGLKRNALYLVRPDGYVALADGVASDAALSSFLTARKLIPGKAVIAP